MFFIGLSTAAPPRAFAQKEGWEALGEAKQKSLLTPRSQAILRKVLLGDNGIATRHLALESLAEAFEINPNVLHARFAKHAPALAAEAARRALDDAGLEPAQIDAVIVSTCTGYLCPGLTSYVSERLGLRPDVLPLDLVGQGCGAALPNLRAAAALLNDGRCERVLSICVEVCSAAFYLDNDPGVLISACLFGDGAGAAVLARDPLPDKRRIRWMEFASMLSPPERDYLRFELRGGMLRNVLTPQVPALAGQFAKRVLATALSRAGVRKEEIAAWVLHAGGRDVLFALREHLDLSEQDLAASARVLREYGNVSSPSVFFVLQATLAGGAKGGYWWMSSFGAGFSCYGALLEVD